MPNVECNWAWFFDDSSIDPRPTLVVTNELSALLAGSVVVTDQEHQFRALFAASGKKTLACQISGLNWHRISMHGSNSVDRHFKGVWIFSELQSRDVQVSRGAIAEESLLYPIKFYSPKISLESKPSLTMYKPGSFSYKSYSADPPTDLRALSSKPKDLPHTAEERKALGAVWQRIETLRQLRAEYEALDNASRQYAYRSQLGLIEESSSLPELQIARMRALPLEIATHERELQMLAIQQPDRANDRKAKVELK